MGKPAKKQVRTSRVLFVLYCIAMLWLLFCRSPGWIPGLGYEEQLRANINLTPLYTIRNYWQVVYHRTNDDALLHCIINLGGNVLLFVPAGVLLPKIWPKQRNFFRFFATCAGLMFLVEVLQLFTLLGSFDIDDLILNLIGMILGFIGYHLFRKKK